MRTTLRSLVALLLVPCAASATTQEKWKQRLLDVDDLLKAENWAEAEKQADDLLGDVALIAASGEASWVAYPMAQIAVARGGQEDRDGAQLWWWTAQQVFPDIARLDMAAYGDVGLAVSDMGKPGAIDLLEPRADAEAWKHEDPLGVHPAILLTSKRDVAVAPRDVIRRPAAKPAADDALVDIRCLVDASGRIVQPRLAAPVPEGAYVAAALRSIARWRVSPAPALPETARITVQFARMSSGSLRRDGAVNVGGRLTTGDVDDRIGEVAPLVTTDPRRAVQRSTEIIEELCNRGAGNKTLRLQLARMLGLRAAAAHATQDENLAHWSSMLARAASADFVADGDESRDDASVQGAPLTITSEMVPPQLLDRVAPSYPRVSSRDGASGEVVLKCVIDAEGRVHLDRIVSAPDDAAIVTASAEAARRWRYAPARSGGDPISVFLTIRMKFNLRP